MEINKSVLRVLICLLFVSVFVTGCKRRPQDYAGIPDPNKGETIDANK